MKNLESAVNIAFMLLFAIVFAFVTASAFASDDGAAVYHLGADDEIKIIIFGEDDLSGDYKVSGDGSVSMPLIGEVPVNGLSLAETEDLIEAKLADGYLLEPSVSVAVSKYRPFYILGEVREPGSYSYVSNMTALNAIALAGGFTYRANSKSVQIMRGGQAEGSAYEEFPVEAKVMPGDVIMIKERFF